MSSEEIQYTLSVETDLVQSEVKQLETVLMRVLSYVERLAGGNPNLARFINGIQAAITAVRTFEVVLRSLERVSLSSPIGLAFFAANLVSAGFAGYGIYESMRGAY